MGSDEKTPGKVKRRRPSRPPEVERRIRQLMDENGLERPLATQVALGRVDLNDVLKKMALNAEVDRLIRRHDLSRALATQVALGQADLTTVLRKRRMTLHLEEHKNRSILEEARASGRPLAIALHGNRAIEGKILDVDRYEFTAQERTGEPEVIHKLQAKFATQARDRKKARRALSYDKALRSDPKEPIWKPQDRYTCSNRRLFAALDAEQLVEVTLLEGEVFKGKLAWIGRYEFGLEVKGKVELVIFRHALANLVEHG